MPDSPRELPPLVFAHQLPKARVVANGVQVAILAHVSEVAIAKFDGLAQRLKRLIGPLEQGKAACQVVVREGVVRPELYQAAVNLKSLGVAALQRKNVAHDTQDVDVVGAPLEDAGVEIEFEF